MEEQGKQMGLKKQSDIIPDKSDNTSIDFNELEKQLESDIATHLSEVQLLEEQKAVIGNPESLGKTIMNVVWVQFINQIGTVAGEDFIKENHNLPLDLSYEAHVQTVENFKDGKFATHNSAQIAENKYSDRYDKWQDSFQHDDHGNVKTHTDRTHRQVENIEKQARMPYDAERPHGSREKNLAMDHTVPVAEIIRDPEMAVFMDDSDRIAFANSTANLRELRADWNQSKSDLPMREWLETPNANGQTPEQIFDITPEQKAELIKRDEEARAYMAKLKKEAEDKTITEGKQSQKEEAFRIGGKALRSVVMGLLAQLVRKIIGKLITWFKTKSRNLETLINQIKEAIIDFLTDVKTNLMVSADTMITTIVVSAVGDFLRKIWIMIKQTARSVIDAIQYLKNPENRKKSVGVLALEVGKIIIAGLTTAGAILLGEVIEKSLLSIPGFAITIPLIGSLASIIGMFISGVIMGVVGALVMSLIDSLIAKSQKQEITKLQIDKNNDVLADQQRLIAVKRASSSIAREAMLEDAIQRHEDAKTIINAALDNIFGPEDIPEST